LFAVHSLVVLIANSLPTPLYMAGQTRRVPRTASSKAPSVRLLIAPGSDVAATGGWRVPHNITTTGINFKPRNPRAPAQEDVRGGGAVGWIVAGYGPHPHHKKGGGGPGKTDRGRGGEINICRELLHGLRWISCGVCAAA